jgi:putative transposase
MKYPFIAAEKAFFPAIVLCSILNVLRSGFYALSWCGESKGKSSDAQITLEFAVIHRRSRGI